MILFKVLGIQLYDISYTSETVYNFDEESKNSETVISDLRIICREGRNFVTKIALLKRT